MLLTLISLSDSLDWDSVVSEFPSATAYHLSGYHQAAHEEGEAYLLVFLEENANKRPIAAIPLIKRSIPETEYFDLTSVYGYPGWLFASEITLPKMEKINEILARFCKENRIVSIFSRLNPFEEYIPLSWVKIGEVRPINPTVWVETMIYPQGRSPLLGRSLRKAVAQGLQIKIQGIEDVETFQALYHRTMQDKKARPFYFFNREYFEKLFLCKEISPFFLMAILNKEVVASALFFHLGDTAYYHLGGTSTHYLSISPLKSLIDYAICYYQERGIRRVLLGGGYNGSKQDGLMFFKNQFSKQQVPFSGWQWITDREVYDLLSKKKAENNYFPLYRSI